MEKIINLTIKNLKGKEINISNILNELFLNETLKEQYLADIRRFSVIWDLTNRILKITQSNERCKVLAIWDIKYFWDLKNEWENLVSKSLTKINPENILWYDISWMWNLRFKRVLYNYMNTYYHFNDSIDSKKIINEIIPVYWATDGFWIIVDSIKELFWDKKINLIYPEASFLSNIKIAESIIWKDNLIKINKSSPSNYFVTKNDIETIKKWEDVVNIYYITPVWNPTWEKLNTQELYKLLSFISDSDENSYFIMDNVYVWLLKEENSTKLFSNIFSNSKLLNKIIFLESLSKTLWTTWIRLWWIWSFNSILTDNIKKITLLKKAWFSKIISEFWVNFLSDLDEISKFQIDVYTYFSIQRLWFLEEIKAKYSHYFNFEYMPKVLDREWIYLLLKINDWYTIQEIFEKTWIIGVKIELSDWIYIRYAFWNVNYY